MTVDNFDKIKELLEFSDNDVFYFVQIIRRRKDPGNEDMSTGSRIIKSYYIESIDYLDAKKEEITNLCKFFNARATIRINRRSYKKTAHAINKEIADLLSTDSYKAILKAVDSASGKTIGKNVDKRWIIDIDWEWNESEMMAISNAINTVMPIGNKIINVIPSKSGYHLITKPFNLQEIFQNEMISEMLKKEDIKKDSFTNLFIL